MIPKNAEYYGWSKFVKWCEENGINLQHAQEGLQRGLGEFARYLLEYANDWRPWWECWCAGYRAGING